MAISSEICSIAGCGGQVQPLQNLYLHTLGGDKSKADLSEFIECEVKRCARCGNLQISAADTPFKVDARR